MPLPSPTDTPKIDALDTVSECEIAVDVHEVFYHGRGELEPFYPT